MTVECKFYGIVNFVVRDVVITKVALYIGNIFRKGVILVGGDKVGMEAVLHMKVDIGSDVTLLRSYDIGVAINLTIVNGVWEEVLLLVVDDVGSDMYP